MTPKVDEKIRNTIPPLTAEEFGELESQLVTHGCRDPLVVWKERGVLLDGHNRLRICAKHNFEYQTVSLSFECFDDAIIWVIRNQFGRRNLSKIQRVDLAMVLEGFFRKKGKDNQEARTDISQKPVKSVDTQKELAAVAGVSHDTIAKVKAIDKEADEKLKERLRASEISINAAYQQIRKPHVTHNSGENEWYTPPRFLESARDVMGGIDCDPASSKQANKAVQAEVYYDHKVNGLDQTWGDRVWMNPPYGQPLMAQFAEAISAKCESGEVSQACVLVNNATETAWFQRMLSVAAAVCFVSGRIKFFDHTGTPKLSPLQGQAILYFGPRRQRFATVFSVHGKVLTHAS